MNAKLIFAGLFAALVLAAPAKAQTTLEMADITCKDFSGYAPDRQDFVSNWMRGYFMAQKNLTVIDSRYVKRNSEKIVRYCKKLPNAKLMNAVEKNAR
ncbi:HdeA/HdeB family chaperone [Methylocystis sp. JAN1]|uniref:HdeA/HdeB family chaperone n=1 Tax=Methylocystis sp. JAN1 TaxID=3397211 RepID=UPI003FA1C9DD